MYNQPIFFFLFFLSKTVPNLSGSIYEPELTHPEAITLPSDVQYFTIRGQYFTLHSQYFTIRGLYLNYFLLNFFTGNSPALKKIMTDPKIVQRYISELKSSSYKSMRFWWNPSLSRKR